MERQLKAKLMAEINTNSTTTASTSFHLQDNRNNSNITTTTTNTTTLSTSVNHSTDNVTSFEYLTVCHNTIISTLESIHFRYIASPSSHWPNTGTGSGTDIDIDIDIDTNTSCTKEEDSSGTQKKIRKKLKCYKIARLLAHEETGNWQSYMRDNDVRKWCAIRSIPFIEYNQTGVTRRLRNRDDYLKNFKLFMSKPIHALKLSPALSSSFRNGLILQLDRLPGFLSAPNGIVNIFDNNNDGDDRNNCGRSILADLPLAHRFDRKGRQQFGGETKALQVLKSFLSERGTTYMKDISSPNTSWNSCSRLSPYLTWGHVSLRYVLKCVEQRRDLLRRQKSQGINIGTTWLRSLQGFASRIHWRSHFIQKLESEPFIEKRDLCSSYQHLRRQLNDWDENKYIAWSTGTTGYPFVDACMRCLIEHGWINFRMRAMLVSFATYNLWLDWKRIAPHLARVFLDYEPGIHYPQLQMQAGTTGINAMRVYNVTKQSKDQDPNGVFIRRYIKELKNCPDQYIHEPWKMSTATRQRCYKTTSSVDDNDDSDNDSGSLWYPDHPIVEERESARIAKEKINEVKKALVTRITANQVYIKHGSRNSRSDKMNGRTSGCGALPAVIAAISSSSSSVDQGKIRQSKIDDIFSVNKNSDSKKKVIVVDLTTKNSTNDINLSNRNDVKQKLNSSLLNCREKMTPVLFTKKCNHSPKRPSSIMTSPIDLTESLVSVSPFKRLKKSLSATTDGDGFISATTSDQKHSPQTLQNTDLPIATNHIMIRESTNAKTCKTREAFHAPINNVSREQTKEGRNWICTACTFRNDKPHGLVCNICGTER